MIDSIKHNAEMSRLAYKASQHATIDRRFQDDLWPWRQALQAIKDIGGPDCHDMNEQGVLEHFKSLSGKNLAGTIRRYLVREFHQRLRGVRLWLRFEDSEPPRLMAQCDDLLAVFYWMLARDEESARAPLVCASCKRFFLSSGRGRSIVIVQLARSRAAASWTGIETRTSTTGIDDGNGDAWRVDVPSKKGAPRPVAAVALYLCRLDAFKTT